MRAILIAPNNEERDILSFALRHEGLQVHSYVSVDAAFPGPTDRASDMIVLCVKTDELLERIPFIQSYTRSPILLVADALTEDQHCDYLDAWIDSVLQRPISSRIFVRYTKQLLRRAGSSPNSLLRTVDSQNIQLNPADRTVTVESYDPVRLTQLEFRLLYLLMTNVGQVITLEDLIERVWGYSGDGNRDLVRGLVRRLRKKIEPNRSEPRFIHNLTGVGYRFVDE